MDYIQSLRLSQRRVFGKGFLLEFRIRGNCNSFQSINLSSSLSFLVGWRRMKSLRAAILKINR